MWDLKDLGLQAAQRILAAADPLAALADVAQNFPALAGALSRLEVAAPLRAEVAANARILPPGATYLSLNGQYVDVGSLDLISLLDVVQREVRSA